MSVLDQFLVLWFNPTRFELVLLSKTLLLWSISAVLPDAPLQCRKRARPISLRLRAQPCIGCNNASFRHHFSRVANILSMVLWVRGPKVRIPLTLKYRKLVRGFTNASVERNLWNVSSGTLTQRNGPTDWLIESCRYFTFSNRLSSTLYDDRMTVRNRFFQYSISTQYTESQSII